MRMSIRASTKKRGRPKTTGKGEQIVVRMHQPQLGALDRWIADQSEPRPTRAGAIRDILAECFKVNGYPPSKPPNAGRATQGEAHAKGMAHRAIDSALHASTEPVRVKQIRKRALTEMPAGFGKKKQTK
jgi:hypothetical protein